jgi:hypothetical protein
MDQAGMLTGCCLVLTELIARLRKAEILNADDVMGVFAGSLDIAKKRNGMTPTQDAAAAITYVERMRSAVLVKSGE